MTRVEQEMKWATRETVERKTEQAEKRREKVK